MQQPTGTPAQVQQQVQRAMQQPTGTPAPQHIAAWKIHDKVLTSLRRSQDTALSHGERLKSLNNALAQNQKLGPKIKSKPLLVEEMGMTSLREALVNTKAELL